MRICYIVHSQSHFAQPYVDYFARRGNEVHVISFTREPIVARAMNHHPLAHDCDPLSNNLQYVRAIPQVRRIVRAIAPDLLHAHFLTSNGLVAAMSGFHPLVVSARGSDVHFSMKRRLRRAMIRFVMRRADLVNPVSEELAAKIARLGISPAKTVCLTQGIDLARFAGLRRVPRSGPVRMICTRKLQHPYQPITIVEALANVSRGGLDFHFTFAAGGRDDRLVQDLVERHGLAGRVTFLGGYAAAALPGLLAASDVYVSASLWDGTSPALLEAMAAGVYPVVTDCPANREWLRGDGDGVLFPSEDVAALTRALAAASCDPRCWATASARNRRTVSARADSAANLAVLEGHYDRLVSAARNDRRSQPAGAASSEAVEAARR